MNLLLEKTAAEAEKRRREYEALSDEALRAVMDGLREETLRGVPLNRRMARAFGAAAESCRRHLGLTPYPVQYMAGASLARCEIAQMNTGEGKTLTSILPACLRALDGRGVHVITVNEYLARRDFEANRTVYEALGLSVGLSLAGMSTAEKQAAYQADVTYTTATEAGFDYLRDGVAVRTNMRVQRGLYYAIVDEADSILLDEAVTPMILSGGGEGDIRDYKVADTLVKYLKPLVFSTIDDEMEIDDLDGDYVVDERRKSAVLTARGIRRSEQYYRIDNLADLENLAIHHRILQAISAYGTLKRDVDYIIRDGKIQLVDRNTGRVMEGRRYAAGLHQAVEAKERVEIHQESRTLSLITYQKYFSLYSLLCGMTGTAWSARRELSETYNVKVRRIPPNRPCIRIDRPDRYFQTQQEKLSALADDALEAWRAGRPVLIGTPNDSRSEVVSKLLQERGVPHKVLNAKQDADEAALVAGAGMPGSVIVATNMAGRGTDIRLGGGREPEAGQVRAAGGLLVLGAERQRSRRVDDQLVGRSGRQGDPGESRFFVSQEDDIIRLFSDEKPRPLSPAVARRAQLRAEDADFSQRKGALEADCILQDHRYNFLKDRNRLLETDDPAGLLREMIANTVRLLREEYPDPANRYADFRIAFHRVFGSEAMPEAADTPDEAAYAAGAEKVLAAKEEAAPDVFDELARAVMLQCADEAWSMFLEEFENLKTGYHLMSVGKSSPRQVLIEYSFPILRWTNGYVLKEGLRRVFQCRLERKKEE